LLRFDDPVTYGIWLKEHNWISQLLFSGWNHRGQGLVWGYLCDKLSWTIAEIRSLCESLWESSRKAMEEIGSLLHSDYSPQNCFLDYATRSQLCVFDFDYVFVADPAYEVGIAANSLARLLVNNGVGSLTEYLDGFFTEYKLEYQHEVGPTDREMHGVMSRGRAFAGLALAATLDDEAMRLQIGAPNQLLIEMAGSLLRWLDGEIQEVEVMTRTLLADSRHDSFGRALLRSSLDMVQTQLRNPHPTLPSRYNLRGAWHELTKEVLGEFVMEEEMVQNGLSIYEDRPRRFFAVLPLDEHWQAVRGTNKTSDGTELDARFRRFEIPGEQQTKRQTRLDILLPVTHGFRRTFQSLACLGYDVKHLFAEFWIEFHVCVNFTDENSLEEVYRFARTIASAHRIPVTLYSLDLRDGMSSMIQWRKTTALNIMLGHIIAGLTNKERADSDQHYLHFDDTDIVILPGHDVIKSNIDRLRAMPTVRIVSGSYTCDDDHGFSAISSVRKRRKYVFKAGLLLNLYGGCMTTTLGRLQSVLKLPLVSLQLPEDTFSEDCYLTVKANAHLFGGQNPSPSRFLAFADTRVTVRHPEPTNIIHFSRRVFRDNEWGRRAAGDYLAEFNKIRMDSFGEITRRIEQGAPALRPGLPTDPPVVRDILAQAWNRAIREKLEEVRNLFNGLPSETDAVDWFTHKTQHQICKDIVGQPDIYESILRTVRQGAFGQELVHAMEEAVSNSSEQFPKMSWLLVQTRRDQIAHVLRTNRFLYHWYAIAEESVANAIQFMRASNEQSALELNMLSDERRQEICGKYPLPPILKNWEVVHNPDQNLDARPANQRESYAAFISLHSRERFLRYYTVIGRGKFAEDSPRRTVYLHVLGEKLIKSVSAASLRIGAPLVKQPRVQYVPTIYPKLALATINYAGPEPRTSAERFLRCAYVQRSIRGKGERFWAVKMGDSQHEDLANCLGNFLARVHGTTLGVRSYLERCYVDAIRHDELDVADARWPFVNLLIEHLNQIRLFQSAAYRHWLRSGREFPGSLPSVLNSSEFRYGITGTVSKILQGDGLSLSDHWEMICAESELFHLQFGSLGHMGIYAANLFLEHNFLGCCIDDLVRIDHGQRVRFAPPELKIGRIHIANHSRTAMVDPAIEAGLVLAELISSRFAANVAVRSFQHAAVPLMAEMSLRSIQKCFVAAYSRTLESLFEEYDASKNRYAANPFMKDTAAEFIPSRDIRRWKTRTTRAAAFALLSRFHNRREYELTEDERTQLVHLIVDLLHLGVEFRFPFRAR
jgi:hypothetical protein